MSEKLVKLVRDKIPDNLSQTILFYEELDRDIHVEELRKKLIEEATEYLMNPSIEELADVYEVVRALVFWDLGYAPSALEAAREHKAKKKGGFDNAVGMFVEVTEED